MANPPDLLWLVAAPWKLVGKRFIFDHHDLVPELFQVRYAKRLPWLNKVMLWLERSSIRLADQVISTNQTFRQMAMTRGKVATRAMSRRPQRSVAVAGFSGPCQSRKAFGPPGKVAWVTSAS